MEVPMLDDEAFAVTSKLYHEAFGFGKSGSIAERMQPLVECHYASPNLAVWTSMRKL